MDVRELHILFREGQEDYVVSRLLAASIKTNPQTTGKFVEAVRARDAEQIGSDIDRTWQTTQLTLFGVNMDVLPEDVSRFLTNDSRVLTNDFRILANVGGWLTPDVCRANRPPKTS